MKECPILFSAPMVRSILGGAKTQTRRAVTRRQALEWLEPDGFTPEFVADPGNHLCPYGVPGDRLWVRETWGLLDTQPSDGPSRAQLFYRATESERADLRYQLWRPSIHMPRWASRITLELKTARVQRLCEVSWKDVAHEGVACPEHDFTAGFCVGECDALYEAFAKLWNGINGKRAGRSWSDNPWVWVLEFEQLPRSSNGAT